MRCHRREYAGQKKTLMNDDIRLIAIDWGTSFARAYTLDAQGAVIAERSLPLGIQRIAVAFRMRDWQEHPTSGGAPQMPHAA